MALAMVLNVDELPTWMRSVGSTAALRGNPVGVTVQRNADALPQYTMSVPRLGSGVGIARRATPNAVIGNTFALRGLAGRPSASVACGEQNRANCKLSDTASEIALLLSQGASSNQTGLRSFIESKGLVFDSHSVRRVIAGLDAQGGVERVDFVGLVRQANEELSAPDATSSEVLRIHRGGSYEIVKRQQDAPINLRDVKFGFERSQ
ncbi:hypothetical protein [Novosphingobium sp.]|uniref:hypothetical protein n=1 Tax=Novosphingobium sp. TaxID=1874826 RepID=UPI002FDB850E